jgi:hypothetical protein
VQYKIRLICTLSSKNHFFPLSFSNGVFDETCIRGNRPRGSVVKQPKFLWIGRRTRSPSPCSVARGLLPKL